ncbi:hypothetical protein DSO57_1011911 [Entomophthora muscae]|uniref:Uncharacterized protein n=1 Tax=Entomophthora muscae TaxID=34485 RepID=A0ACC2SJ67_9FUNG|nr:hypothetical protein DSO57_1011911 [Entomophthora muscae]
MAFQAQPASPVGVQPDSGMGCDRLAQLFCLFGQGSFLVVGISLHLLIVCKSQTSELQVFLPRILFKVLAPGHVKPAPDICGETVEEVQPRSWLVKVNGVGRSIMQTFVCFNVVLDYSRHFEGSKFCHNHHIRILHGKLFEEGGFKHVPVFLVGVLFESFTYKTRGSSHDVEGDFAGPESEGVAYLGELSLCAVDPEVGKFLV